MAVFTSAFLGKVDHPKNVLKEYLVAFGNKCQADILSWLDGWTHTKRSQGKEDWVRLVTAKLAEELGYCKDTIHRHLDKLFNLGVIDRQRAKLWSTDRAYEYRIVFEKLVEYLDNDENQTIDSLNTVHQESVISPLIVQNQTLYINTSVNVSEIKHNNTEPVVVEKEDVEESAEHYEPSSEHKDGVTEVPKPYAGVTGNKQQPELITEDSSTPGMTDITEESSTPTPSKEELAEVISYAQKLGIEPTTQVLKLVCKYWTNVLDALAALEEAIKAGRCQHPQAYLSSALRKGWKPESVPVPANKNTTLTEANPPTEEQRAILDAAKRERTIYDHFFSATDGVTKVVMDRWGKVQIPWYEFFERVTAPATTSSA